LALVQLRCRDSRQDSRPDERGQHVVVRLVMLCRRTADIGWSGPGELQNCWEGQELMSHSVTH